MKTIVITGASRGIGYQTALKLAGKGHQVIATARTESALEELKSSAQSDLLFTVSADLATSEGIDLITSFCSTFDGIDGLINNAGLLLNKPFLETPVEDWNQQFQINVLSVARLIKALFPLMNEGGHIVNIGSMGGFQGSDKFPGLTAYSVSKGALATLTECLATEFEPSKISVNCLALGAVQTEMLNEAFPGYEAPVHPKEMGTFIADFTLSAHLVMNGRILPVTKNSPQ
jgi:NAD(P)-dependent dehydrogenase (short-subunit alcohol dehydrogenase family)